MIQILEVKIIFMVNYLIIYFMKLSAATGTACKKQIQLGQESQDCNYASKLEVFKYAQFVPEFKLIYVSPSY